MSDKTTPELEHKAIDPKYVNKPDDEDECVENGGLDDCDFVNEKQPLNKNNVKTSTLSLNNKKNSNALKHETASPHIDSEMRGPTKLKKKNSYKVNKAAVAANNNHSAGGGMDGMTTPESSKFQTSKLAQLEETLRRRSGLSRSGLLFVILLMLLLVVMFVTLLVLVVLWPRNLHSQVYPICRSPACLTSSAQMLPMLNESIPICEDFRSYACGSWLKKNSVPPQHRDSANMKTLLTYKRKEQIRDLLSTMPLPELDTSWSWKMKTFYDSCMDGDTIEADKTRNIQAMLDNLGLKKSNLNSWDPKRTLIKIHSEHGATPFFKADVVPDPKDALMNIIRISPSGLSLPDKKFYSIEENPSKSPLLHAYIIYRRDLMQYLGHTSVEAEQFSENGFHYEKRIAKIFPDSDVLEDGFRTYKTVTLQEIQQSARSLPLFDILIAKFPEAKITRSTSVLVPENYIEEISNLISESDKKPLQRYLTWILINHFSLYISEASQKTSNMFRRALHGEVDALPRWEFCVDTLQKYMSLGVAALVENSEVDRPSVNHAVDEVFASVKKTIVKNFQRADWIEAELRKYILEKIQKVSIQVGLPVSLKLDKYISEYYADFYAHKSDFFATVMSATNFVQRENEQRLITPSEETRWLDAVVSSDLTVSYSVSANKVIVPRSLLVEPFFDPDYILPVIYGRFGVELAHAILSSVSPWNILYGVDGALLDTEYPAVNAAIETIQATQPCIARAIARSSQKSAVSNFTTNFAMTKISAVRQTFKALEFVLSSSPHIHQPAMETIEPPALFFVAYAQSICSMTTREHHKFLEIQDLFSDITLLKTVITQSKEFSNVFSCADSSQLYTEDACPDVI